MVLRTLALVIGAIFLFTHSGCASLQENIAQKNDQCLYQKDVFQEESMNQSGTLELINIITGKKK